MYEIPNGARVTNTTTQSGNNVQPGQRTNGWGYSVRPSDAILDCWTHSAATDPALTKTFISSFNNTNGYGVTWSNGVTLFFAIVNNTNNQGANSTGHIRTNTAGAVRMLTVTQDPNVVAAQEPRTYYIENNGANDFTIDPTSTFYSATGDNVIEGGTTSDAIQRLYKTRADYNARNSWNAVGSTRVISGAATDFTPTITADTGGNGVYGISEADSPAVTFNATLDGNTTSVTLEKGLTEATDIRDDIYNKLRVVSPYNGVDPSNAANQQPPGAMFYLTQEGEGLRFTHVTLGNPPDADEMDFTWSTVDSNGNSYGESQFGGFISDSVMVTSQGTAGDNPPVVRVSHTRHGNADIILFGNNHTSETVTDTIGSTLAGTGVWTYDSTANTLEATDSPMDDDAIQNTLPTSEVLQDTDSILPTNFALDPTLMTQGVTGSTDSPVFRLTSPEGVTTTHMIMGMGTLTAAQVAMELMGIVTQTQWDEAIASNNLEYTDTERRDRTRFTDTRDDYPFIPDSGIWTVEMISAGTSGTNTVGNAQFPTTPIPAVITESGISIKNATPSSMTIEFGGLEEGTGVRMLTFGDANGPVATPEEIAEDIIVSIQSDAVVGRRVTATRVGRAISIRPNQFGENSVYVSAITEEGFIAGTNGPATVPTDNSVDPQPNGTGMMRDFGTPATLTYANLGITTNSISSTLDVERPWEATRYNPNRLYPIFAQTFAAIDENSGDTVLTNRIRAADIGFLFGDQHYISYVERRTIGLTPEFDTEQLTSVALWADGGTPRTIGGEPSQATLRLSVRGTDNPGELTDLTDMSENNRKLRNDFIIGDDYKIDVRIHGRFVNFRIDDANTVGNPHTDVEWRISGMQFDIMKGGTR